MSQSSLQDNLSSHAIWRKNLISGLERYHTWRQNNKLDDANSTTTLLSIIQSLVTDKVTLAFVAEFSRGKTELINALFFGETGVRLLPSTPGRTTMSPTELFYDEKGGNYIRLLDIESRTEDTPLFILKQDAARWKHIEFNPESSEQMQTAFKELVAVKKVPKAKAIELGLYDERLATEMGIEKDKEVEIPCWRHALISFPHPLLKEGLTILDTPGLNALGSEPELTLNMLPSAQAIVFVIAADTGVTKSDMEMWTNHVSKATKAGKQGLAVVMNKIDVMKDDFASENEFQKTITSQLNATAKTLSLSEDLIFPVSAKQALIGKIKSDDELIRASRIANIEQYLANDIIQQRQKLLAEVISRDIGFLVTESFSLTESKYAQASKQLEDLKKLDFENRSMIEKLVSETTDEQQTYLYHLSEFKKNRDIFARQLHSLINSLSPERIERLLKLSRNEISKSVTTYGMKQSISKLFEDLRLLLQSSIDKTIESQTLIKSIHAQFHEEYGFREIEPKLFLIDPYQAALEKLYAEGEAYRQSTRVTLTEQSVVVKKLYETIIYKARNILSAAHKDAETWGRNVMSPLMHQIVAYKKQIEDRLVVLNSSIESKENLNENLARLSQELTGIIEQRNELNAIVKDIEGESPIFDKNASFLINDISRNYVDLL
jgi:hypothetical protein